MASISGTVARDRATATKTKTASKEWSRFLIPAVCLIGSALLFHYLSDGTFLTSRNLSNLSRQVCINLTLAVGMTLVILTSGIDLSVGSVLALSGMVGAITQTHWGWANWGAGGAVLSFLAALMVGLATGSLTGIAISRLKITPFIVTLGMMVICRGLTLIVSGAQAVAPVGSSLGSLSADYVSPNLSLFLIAVGVLLSLGLSLRQYLADRKMAVFVPRLVSSLGFGFAAWYVFCGYRGIPYMVFFAAFVACGGLLILKYTRFGRFIYAIGGNREAAELSGVPVGKTLLLTYLGMGLLAGLAGVMDIARVNGAVPSAGELAELDAIAAVVIGGTSLMGGMGSVSGTLFGVLIMGVLNNGMSLVGISEHYQKVFKGIVIILAVFLDLRSKKK